MLIKSAIEPPWIHTLESLLDLVTSKTPELEKYREILVQLTPYATEYRYPGKMAKEEAEKCITIIRELRNNIRQILITD